MKQLFALRNAVTGAVAASPTFERKPDAKNERNRLWAAAGSPKTKDWAEAPGEPIYPFVVTYGPDHYKSK